jgi:hypothetical protein
LTVEQVKPPRGLGVSGRRLWREIVADAAQDGLELVATERFWLHSACKLVDQAAAIEAALKDAPLYMKGSMGQDVSNPLLGELRQLHLAINQTLARLKLDVAEAPGIVPGVNQGRRAINTRWRGGA